MRILFFGNARASVLTVRSLTSKNHRIMAISPFGGPGHEWHESLQDECESLGIECYDFVDPNGEAAIEVYKKFDPEIIISVLYNSILSEEVTSIAPYAINFHPSLLPSYRGTAPLIWAMVNGEEECGVTAHFMERKVDCGEIVGRRIIPIDDQDTGFDLHNKAALEICDLAEEIINLVENGRLRVLEPLDLVESYFSSKTRRVNELKPSSQTCEQIRDIVRALAPPLPCAWFQSEGVIVKVAAVENFDTEDSGVSNLGITPGFHQIDGYWHIHAIDGILKVSELA